MQSHVAHLCPKVSVLWKSIRPVDLCCVGSNLTGGKVPDKLSKFSSLVIITFCCVLPARVEKRCYADLLSIVTSQEGTYKLSMQHAVLMSDAGLNVCLRFKSQYQTLEPLITSKLLYLLEIA